MLKRELNQEKTNGDKVKRLENRIEMLETENKLMESSHQREVAQYDARKDEEVKRIQRELENASEQIKQLKVTIEKEEQERANLIHYRLRCEEVEKKNYGFEYQMSKVERLLDQERKERKEEKEHIRSLELLCQRSSTANQSANILKENMELKDQINKVKEELHKALEERKRAWDDAERAENKEFDAVERVEALEKELRKIKKNKQRAITKETFRMSDEDSTEEEIKQLKQEIRKLQK